MIKAGYMGWTSLVLVLALNGCTTEADYESMLKDQFSSRDNCPLPLNNQLLLDNKDTADRKKFILEEVLKNHALVVRRDGVADNLAII